MHAILAPTLIRAKQYAAGLGLPDQSWKSTTDVGAVASVVHLLPGLEPETVAAARAAASRTNGRIVDHT